MAFVTADRVSDTSTSTGTGAFVVSGSPSAGYRTFSAVMSVGDTCLYTIQHATLNEWENGTGTYSSANTLTRTTVSSSSNAGSPVTFSAGTKNVSITLLAPKTVQTDPTTAGNVIFTADGSVWSSTQKIVRGTSVAATSGTSIDFTGIPSWIKRITVMFQGVSTNGTSPVIIQIGNTSFTTTGYVGASFVTGGTGNMSTGFQIANTAGAGDTRYGHAVITNITGNTWVFSYVGGYGNGAYTAYAGGGLALSAVLDRVRITTIGGTNTFNGGTLNILYE